MRIGLMVGSDKERSRADRLAGLIDDGAAAESAGFTAFWMPQVPGYLDAMTAVTLIGYSRANAETESRPSRARRKMSRRVESASAPNSRSSASSRASLPFRPTTIWL